MEHPLQHRVFSLSDYNVSSILDNCQVMVLVCVCILVLIMSTQSCTPSHPSCLGRSQVNMMDAHCKHASGETFHYKFAASFLKMIALYILYALESQILAPAVGIAVSHRSGSQLTMTLAATIFDNISFFSCITIFFSSIIYFSHRRSAQIKNLFCKSCLECPKT